MLYVQQTEALLLYALLLYVYTTRYCCKHCDTMYQARTTRTHIAYPTWYHFK